MRQTVSQKRRAREFIGKSKWIFASTMPENPHWYIVRKACDVAEFEWFVRYIREHGKPECYRKRRYICLYLDGYKYWTMGYPVEETVVINRARVDK